MFLIDGKVDVNVGHLTFQGDAESNAQCLTNGIHILNNAQRIHLFDVRLLELGDCGVVVENTTAPLAFGNRVYIRDCMIDNYNGNGIEITGASNVDVVNCKIQRETGFTATGVPTILEQKGHGIRYKPGIGAEMSDIRITGTQIISPLRNQFHQVTQNAADTAPYSLYIIDNSFEAGGDAVSVDVQDPANFNRRGSGIWMESTTKGVQGHIVITGNVMRHILCYGIMGIQGQENIIVDGNDIDVPWWEIESEGTTYTARCIWIDKSSVAGSNPSVRITNNRCNVNGGSTDFTRDPVIQVRSEGGHTDGAVIVGNQVFGITTGIRFYGHNCVVSNNSFVSGNELSPTQIRGTGSFNTLIGNTSDEHPQGDPARTIISLNGDYNMVLCHANPVSVIGTDNIIALNLVDGDDDLLIDTTQFKVQKDGWLNLARRMCRLPLTPQMFSLEGATATRVTVAHSLGNVDSVSMADTTDSRMIVLVPLPKLEANSDLVVRITYKPSASQGTLEIPKNFKVNVYVNSGAGAGEFSTNLTIGGFDASVDTRDVVVDNDFLTNYSPHRIVVERDANGAGDDHTGSFQVLGVELIYREQMNGEDVA
jgi:hypothetical protein